MILKFILSGQQLMIHPSQERERVVADSKNYLIAQFDRRTSEWKSGPVWVLFTHNGHTYKKLLGSDEKLSENECYVPWEVIHSPRFEVSVYTGDRITTNTVIKKVEESGYTDKVVNEHITPDTISQMNELFKRYALICNSILQDCEKIKKEIQEDK